jgi:hypothetical protein
MKIVIIFKQFWTQFLPIFYLTINNFFQNLFNFKTNRKFQNFVINLIFLEFKFENKVLIKIK